MTNNNIDIHNSDIFTPCEFQVDLLEFVYNTEVNSIICVNNDNIKNFISIKLAQANTNELLDPKGSRLLFITHPQNMDRLSAYIQMLTSFQVCILHEASSFAKIKEILKLNSILVMSLETANNILNESDEIMLLINYLIIDDGVYNDRHNILRSFMNKYTEYLEKPKIILYAPGLLSDNLKPKHLEIQMVRLENVLNGVVHTASDITSLVRQSAKPFEVMVTCSNQMPTSLYNSIKYEIDNAFDFLTDHRFDPSEIYSEYMDEYRNIPNPCLKPLELINEFLFILNEYGCWCANQAALHILTILENLKIKVAYERHYLLLSLLSTVMFKIRALCDNEMDAENDEGIEHIQNWSSHKVIRMISIIKEFKPEKKVIEEIPDFLDVPPPPPPPPPNVRQFRGSKTYKGQRRSFYPRQYSEDSTSVLIFVKNSLVAKVIHSLLKAVKSDPEFSWMRVMYIADKTADPVTEPLEAEVEHRVHEDVLRKFRSHDCNVLVATPMLEQGYDIPKCNVIIRVEFPQNFHSYIYSKSRVKNSSSYYILLVQERDVKYSLKLGSDFKEVEGILLRRSGPLDSEDDIKKADDISECYSPYITATNETVNLFNSIQIINRYCAKLPSDTFTKLVPNVSYLYADSKTLVQLRLPINSPVKQTVESDFVESKVLAKRIAAFRMIQVLHKRKELDDSLNPITKENFRAIEDDWNDFSLEGEDEKLSLENTEQRPGTTKRRQYYFKRIACVLQYCLPKPKSPTYFYSIVMTLTCPIPEEQNTRGRKIYPPEDSNQGFGLLTSKAIPQICPFPIFTRSGEVNVSIELVQEIELDQEEIHKIDEFLNYTFTSVLRLQKYQMLFNPIDAQSNYLIVPTLKGENGTSIDWDFLNIIYDNRDVLPKTIPDVERSNYIFDASQYHDAVVMPWYRNQDQPQYFYVAEICSSLNPASDFPGSEYATFEEYYNRKYNIEIQNKQQHLLDVDHTSARLNFLTPRYVNRKGVALPTSSEETKRAKRENLEQKQILVPELCAIHPFPASLWRKAVCLPCILYRMNALLLADQIRATVANDIGLGQTKLDESHKWSPLNFGWSLSDVLKKSKVVEPVQEELVNNNENFMKEIVGCLVEESMEIADSGRFLEEIITPGADADRDREDWMEIGTWSNDMVVFGENTKPQTNVRYGSPTSWMHSTYGYNEYDDFFSDTESSYMSEPKSDSQCGGLQIQFQNDYCAEAIDSNRSSSSATISEPLRIANPWDNFSDDDELSPNVEETVSFDIIPVDESFKRKTNQSSNHTISIEKALICDSYEPKEELTLDSKIDDDTEPILQSQSDLFSFDYQPDLSTHPGPSPSVILQALTMSNANDGINLERLETIGDSFLKYAITDYLYSKYENTHEGKLSHLRSKQVSNLNLYRLGKMKYLGEMMIATKFDPHDNWLPPCYKVSRTLQDAINKAGIQDNYLTLADYVLTRNMTLQERCSKIQAQGDPLEDLVSIIPYNLVTQHSIPDKSIADCMEALIGAYLIECGPRGALLFMAYLGIRVLPKLDDNTYGKLAIPSSPLLRTLNHEATLSSLWLGYEQFENILDYKFRDKSYLLQALTHASYSPNTLTDCYQRLEFLGDAVLDYLITRHLYEDKRMHSPGALTDLRSALVNNTIFASLAVKYDFHKYFKYLSPALHQVIEKFIKIQENAGHKVTEDLFLFDVEDGEEVEDVEVPKVLGDIFESVAGAIFLDSGRSLDTVWKVYHKMMKKEIEQFSDKVPKSPIRELLELEPETAKFGAAEKLADGRRVRVSVEVFGKGIFKGIGRNYRIAKCTAAKCALKHLKRQPTFSR